MHLDLALGRLSCADIRWVYSLNFGGGDLYSEGRLIGTCEVEFTIEH